MKIYEVLLTRDVAERDVSLPPITGLLCFTEMRQIPSSNNYETTPNFCRLIGSELLNADNPLFVIPVA